MAYLQSIQICTVSKFYNIGNNKLLECLEGENIIDDCRVVLKIIDHRERTLQYMLG